MDEGRPAEERLASEPTPEGEQTLIPGVAPVTDRDRAQVRAEAPKRGGAHQRPADEGQLDVGGRGQGDLVERSRKKSTATVGFDQRWAKMGMEDRKALAEQALGLNAYGEGYGDILRLARKSWSAIEPEQQAALRGADAGDAPGLFAASERRDQRAPAEEPFGPILTGYTNQPEAAIAKLMAERRGEVPDAFVHPTLGPIAFVYGNLREGLAHIAARGRRDILAKLPEILRDGTPKNLGTRYRIVAADGSGAVAIVPTNHKGTPKNWVLSAYYRGDEASPGDGGARQVRSIDVPPASASPRVPDATGRGGDSTGPRVDQASPEADGTPEDASGLPRDIAARVAPALRAKLDRLGLSRVNLRLDADAWDFQGRFERTLRGDMDIIIAASLDPKATVRHEAIHARGSGAQPRGGGRSRARWTRWPPDPRPGARRRRGRAPSGGGVRCAGDAGRPRQEPYRRGIAPQGPAEGWPQATPRRPAVEAAGPSGAPLPVRLAPGV